MISSNQLNSFRTIIPENLWKESPSSLLSEMEFVVGIVKTSICYTRPTLERRKTLGHLRSINRNMIIHFAKQSQTCQLLKIKKKKIIQTFHERNPWKMVQSIPGWTDRENPYRLSYHIYISVYVEFLAKHFNDLSQVCKSEFTGRAILEELSIRRRLRTFLTSWGQKTRVKHCYVDLSSWYELWFAMICIDIPHWPAGVKSNHMFFRRVSLIAQSLTMSPAGSRSGQTS